MKLFCCISTYLTAALLAQIVRAETKPVLLTIADTVNPGTADYIVAGIEYAEKHNSPYLILQLDTPGGLLTSTRTIVQKMLNTKIPIVVYIAPKGAHAGSAGALISLAADIAAMAPGTNIGAAHPVVPGGDKMDKKMSEKMANDVAAFAESLAKAKGRNTEWAAKAVKKSVSIIAEEALEKDVIDLMADDLASLQKKLPGFTLKVAKQGITKLPEGPFELQPLPMNVKQRLVSFFANPELAYMIMSLGALCIWVELTHPGLIFPGVLGGICIILSLVAFQLLPISYGALALILLGFGLLVAELYLPTFGIVGIAGLFCFVIGSLFLMDSATPEFQISLGLILPTTAVLSAFIFLLGYLILKSRGGRVLSGLGSLVGAQGEVRNSITDHPGKVFLNGELWNAISTTGEDIPEGTKIVVQEVKDMLLVVHRS